VFVICVAMLTVAVVNSLLWNNWWVQMAFATWALGFAIWNWRRSQREQCARFGTTSQTAPSEPSRLPPRPFDS
jgi:hypothetical protein